MSDQIGTAKLSPSNAYGVYENCFGALANETTYYDPLGAKFKGLKINLIKELRGIYKEGKDRVEKKALTTTSGGAGTAGYALVPVYVDQRMVDLSRKFTPFIEMTPRVTNQGTIAAYNIINSKGAGFTALEDGPMADPADSEERASKDIKYLYAKGRLTGPALAAVPPYMIQGMTTSGSGAESATFTSQNAPNAKQYEVLKRTAAIRELEESLWWNGNSGTDATQFDGLISQQSTTNQNDLTGYAISWEEVDGTVEESFTASGRPNVSGCDSGTFKGLRKIMIDAFHVKPGDLTQDMGFGIIARMVLETMIGPVPVFPSQYLDNTTGNRQLFFLDMEYIEMRVLQDLTYEEKISSTDSYPFLLKIYETQLVRAPNFNSYADNMT